MSVDTSCRRNADSATFLGHHGHHGRLCTCVKFFSRDHLSQITCVWRTTSEPKRTVRSCRIFECHLRTMYTRANTTGVTDNVQPKVFGRPSVLQDTDVTRDPGSTSWFDVEPTPIVDGTSSALFAKNDNGRPSDSSKRHVQSNRSSG